MDYSDDDDYREIIDIRGLSKGNGSREKERKEVVRPATKEKPETVPKNKRKALFKRAKPRRRAPTVPVRDTTYGPIDEPETVSQRVSKDSVSSQRHSRASRQGQKRYHEFGTSVNGYKFVASDGSNETLNEQRLKTQHLLREGYSGNTELEETVRLTPLVDKYSADYYYKKAHQTYEEYLQKWESLGNGQVIVWPNSRNSAAKNDEESIRLFLAGKDGKAWKQERIRWHPDNINKRFQLDDDQKGQVTKVFQVFNHIWEREFKR